MTNNRHIRTPVAAGSFYPRTKAETESWLQQFYSCEKADIDFEQDDLIALLVPHAGWIYSGQTAARAFKVVSDIEFDSLMFWGVDHRSGLPTISVWAEGGYQTPLGIVASDKELSSQFLSQHSSFVYEPQQHIAEHSLEVLVPFLQFSHPNMKAAFISIGWGASNYKLLLDATKKILPNLSKKTLIVVSTDMSHFHSKETANAMDHKAINSILNLDPDRLIVQAEDNSIELCGFSGTLAATTLFNEISGRTFFIDYTDSSEKSGDTTSVVGYSSIIFSGRKANIK